MLFDPDWARRFEDKFAAHGEGLLKGGSSWSNIFSGGAAPEESDFCVARTGFGETWRWAQILAGLFFLLLELPAMLRISGLVLLELVIGLPEAARGIFRGRGFPGARHGVIPNVRRGSPPGDRYHRRESGCHPRATCGDLNFLGYDELSHRRVRARGLLIGLSKALIVRLKISIWQPIVRREGIITSGYFPITGRRKRIRSRWSCLKASRLSWRIASR